MEESPEDQFFYTGGNDIQSKASRKRKLGDYDDEDGQTSQPDTASQRFQSQDIPISQPSSQPNTAKLKKPNDMYVSKPIITEFLGANSEKAADEADVNLRLMLDDKPCQIVKVVLKKVKGSWRPTGLKRDMFPPLIRKYEYRVIYPTDPDWDYLSGQDEVVDDKLLALFVTGMAEDEAGYTGGSQGLHSAPPSFRGITARWMRAPTPVPEQVPMAAGKTLFSVIRDVNQTGNFKPGDWNVPKTCVERLLVDQEAAGLSTETADVYVYRDTHTFIGVFPFSLKLKTSGHCRIAGLKRTMFPGGAKQLRWNVCQTDSCSMDYDGSQPGVMAASMLILNVISLRDPDMGSPEAQLPQTPQGIIQKLLEPWSVKEGGADDHALKQSRSCSDVHGTSSRRPPNAQSVHSQKKLIPLSHTKQERGSLHPPTSLKPSHTIALDDDDELQGGGSTSLPDQAMQISVPEESTHMLLPPPTTTVLLPDQAMHDVLPVLEGGFQGTISLGTIGQSQLQAANPSQSSECDMTAQTYQLPQKLSPLPGLTTWLPPLKWILHHFPNVSPQNPNISLHIVVEKVTLPNESLCLTVQFETNGTPCGLQSPNIDDTNLQVLAWHVIQELQLTNHTTDLPTGTPQLVEQPLLVMEAEKSPAYHLAEFQSSAMRFLEQVQPGLQEQFLASLSAYQSEIAQLRHEMEQMKATHQQALDELQAQNMTRQRQSSVDEQPMQESSLHEELQAKDQEIIKLKAEVEHFRKLAMAALAGPGG